MRKIGLHSQISSGFQLSEQMSGKNVCKDSSFFVTDQNAVKGKINLDAFPIPRSPTTVFSFIASWLSWLHFASTEQHCVTALCGKILLEGLLCGGPAHQGCSPRVEVPRGDPGCGSVRAWKADVRSSGGT